MLPIFVRAQDPSSPPPYKPTPDHMWEFGLHAGAAMSFGDIDFEPNLGGGFHVRRAIDYVFSVRGDAFMGKLKQKSMFDGTSETTVQSGSVQLVVSINNLIWDNVQHRKANLYTFIGGGVTRFQVDAVQALSTYLKAVDPTVQTHLDGGLGVAFRISNRFNLGVEAKALAIFGKDADRLDGVARRQKDVMGYGNLRLNFNLGNTNTKSEPLYWVNPMDVIMQDITELKKRPVFDDTDSDGDGVIDLLDQDNTTEPGVAVDTRGLPLDSDGDGVPNYKDEEPYVSNGNKSAGTQKGGRAPIATEEDVRRVVQDELGKIAINEPNNNRRTNDSPRRTTDNPRKANDPGNTERTSKGGQPLNDRDDSNDNYPRRSSYTGAISEWFWPLVHFNIDENKIRYAEYGNLASVAHVLKSNPDLVIVVTGFTDKTASDQYNLDLSYRRAKAVIDHLVNVHGIARSRLMLNYNGEDYPLVPSTGSTLMNRRVEFRAATDDDVEMENPEPVSKNGTKKGGF